MDPTSLPGYVPGFALTRNLRDLGGIPASDGRHVRHGLLFRSGPLCGLTADERAIVDGLGLRFMLDLRAKTEVAGKVDYVPSGCGYLRIGGMRDYDGNEMDFSPEAIARFGRGLADRGGMAVFMLELYVDMAFGNPATHELMARLARGEAPLLFHCTAGKDRTGVCAALVLMALGVSSADVMADYLLTNEYRREIMENPPQDRELPNPILADPEEWRRANGVSEEALQGMLDAIDMRYPTREAYLKDEFGLGEREIGALRDRYLA